MKNSKNIDYDYILIDVSSVLYPLYFSKNKTPIIKKMKNGDMIDTSTICAYLRKMYALRKEYPHAKFIHALDPLNYDLSERRKVDPNYKANRKEKEPELLKQLEILPKVFDFLGQTYIQPKKYEADDVIASLIVKGFQDENEPFKDKNILIYSADKDLLQMMLDENRIHFMTKFGFVKSNDPNKQFEKDKEIISSFEQVKEKMGIHPLLIPDFLAMRGDKADNINGIYRLSEKKAIELLNQYGNIVNIVKNLEDMPEDVKKIFTKDNIDLIVKNLDLTFLNTELPLPKDIIVNNLPITPENIKIVSNLINVNMDSLFFLKEKPKNNPENKIDEKMNYNNQNCNQQYQKK